MTNGNDCGIIFALRFSVSCVEKALRPPKDQRSEMNSLRKYRERLLMSKAELARKAGISALTIDRIEKGKSCRLETKRKIILALGLQLTDRGKIFGDNRS